MARTRCPCHFSNPSECNKLHPPPFSREAKKFIYLVRFSRFVKVLFILILSVFDTLADSADICKCLIKRIIN